MRMIDRQERRGSSVVCYADEADAAYMGYLASADLRRLLAGFCDRQRQLADDIAAVLPKVRDPDLHASLASARSALLDRAAQMERECAALADPPGRDL